MALDHIYISISEYTFYEMNSSSPLISIITSVYNDGDNLRKTIASLFDCGYNNIQHVIVDGGSSDETLDVISNTFLKNTKWISEPDNGIYDAWNKGLMMVDGEYIVFLGAGDIFYKNGLAKLVEYALRNPEVEYISARVGVYKGDYLYRIVGEKWDWKRFRRYMLTAHCGALHASSFFSCYGHFNDSYKISGDYDLLLRAGKNLKAGFLDDVVVAMTYGGKSQVGFAGIYEAEFAKIQNKAVGKIVAKIDTCVAIAKGFLRNMFR